MSNRRDANLTLQLLDRQLRARKGREGKQAGTGHILTPPPERRVYPAAPVSLARLPDESGVPVGVAARLGGGAEIRRVAHNGLNWTLHPGGLSVDIPTRFGGHCYET